MAYSIEKAKQEVIRAGKELLEHGLIARTWGNISARISETQFVITPSGRSYETLTPEDLPLVNIADGSYEGDIRPSSEKGVHAVIYRLLPDVDFVIHTHQSNASALSVLGEDHDLYEMSSDLISSAEREVLGPYIPTAEYGMSATQKLTDAVCRAVDEYFDCSTVLLKYHGAVCWGADYESAFRAAYTLEDVSGRIYQRLCGIDLGLPAGRRQQKPLKRGYAIRLRTPFVMEMSRLEREMFPYLDDMAQIAGVSVRCVPRDASNAEIGKALRKRNAVFLAGDGAICVGPDKDEAEAVCLVMEKNCQAAYLAMKMAVKPLPPGIARRDRSFYVDHYAARKDEAE
ncbi:MAG: class II aldolase/adducin family protein [Anaerovoracaceae bacterium]|jgi:L-ribulose-5-phosphate 4-epimerase